MFSFPQHMIHPNMRIYSQAPQQFPKCTECQNERGRWFPVRTIFDSCLPPHISEYRRLFTEYCVTLRHCEPRDHGGCEPCDTKEHVPPLHLGSNSVPASVLLVVLTLNREQMSSPTQLGEWRPMRIIGGTSWPIRSQSPSSSAQ